MLESTRFVRSYLFSLKQFQRLDRFVGAVFTGVWLAALSNRRRAALDARYYDGESMYWTQSYNESGLWGWEKEFIDEHVMPRSSVLVGAAGGGREVIALRRMGFAVSSFECHAGFVAAANELLGHLGLDAAIRLAPRDECPDFGRSFDAAIVGWAGFMLIRGRQRRVRFLRQLRAQVANGAPLLLSFYPSDGGRRFRVAAVIANSLHWLLGGERAEVGDYLSPNYVHFVTRNVLASELDESGFELLTFREQPYGYAFARAR